MLKNSRIFAVGKKKNTGFTLVELIVSIAIMGIVAGMVGSFMMSGINNYQRTSAETNLQVEAQLAANQIQDNLIDANKSVKYYVGIDLVTTDDRTDTTSNRELVITGEGETLKKDDDEISRIIWKPANHTLYYSDKKDTEGSVSEYELARNVTGFYVDMTEFETKKIIYYHLDFSANGRSYSNDYNVTLRNALRKEPSTTADPGGI